MSRKQFIAEQALYFIQFPQADHLQFYQWYTKQHPEDDLGWFSLAEEMEKHNDIRQAITSYKRCMQLNGEYADPARLALQRLDRKSNKEKKRGKRLIGFLLFLSTLLAVTLVLPNDFFAPKKRAEPYLSIVEPSSDENTADGTDHTWIEVVNIDQLDDPKLEQKLFSYWKKREDELGNPVALIVVHEPNLETWTPHLFANSDHMVGMMIRDAYATPRWVNKDCNCSLPSLGEVSQLSIRLVDKYQEQQSTIENWLVLRSALYHYNRLNNSLPAQLNQLTQSSPNNYLSSIPNEYSSLNSEQKQQYLPELVDNVHEWQSLEQVVPFQMSGKTVKVPYAFGPLTIAINKEKLKLTVHSGKYWVRQYQVGLGKEDRTPAGKFSISKKVNQPVSSTKVYGTRGLVLSDQRYAIHGTNSPDSIGQYESHGCIRLNNSDVEDLYAIIPLGTEVNIRNSGKLANFRNPSSEFPPVARDNEHDPTPYKWLH